MQLSSILLFVLSATAFTIPEGQADGLYIVTYDVNGNATHTTLPPPSRVLRQRGEPTESLRVQLPAGPAQPDFEAYCSGTAALNSGDTDKANAALGIFHPILPTLSLLSETQSHCFFSPYHTPDSGEGTRTDKQPFQMHNAMPIIWSAGQQNARATVEGLNASKVRLAQLHRDRTHIRFRAASWRSFATSRRTSIPFAKAQIESLLLMP